MALRHHIELGGIEPDLWLGAENELVEAVARALCERHAYEIWGDEKGPDFVDDKWRCFECEARDAVAIVRRYDREHTTVTDAAAPNPKDRIYGNDRGL